MEFYLRCGKENAVFKITAQVEVPTLPFNRCVIFEQSLNFYESQFL
jgi:hypothetical protein